MTSNNKPYSTAQDKFIKEIRSKIDDNAKDFLAGKDWRNITPCGGRYTGLQAGQPVDVESYYVKPVAMWIPHIIIPGFRPSCPLCGTCANVDINLKKWVTTPKILYGPSGHRYLDSKMYRCNGVSCNQKEFAGFDQRSMANADDANQLTGIFNFHLQKTFAVDEEAFGAIINSAADRTTASMAKSLGQQVADRFFSESEHYYAAVKACGVKAIPTKRKNKFGDQREVTRHDTNQTTIRQHLSTKRPKKATQALILRKQRAERKISNLESTADYWQTKYRTDTNISDILEFKEKDKNKSRKDYFRALGVGKLEKCLQNGITTVFALSEADTKQPQYRFIKQSWRNSVTSTYQSYIEKAEQFNNQLGDARAELKTVVDELDLLDCFAVVDDILGDDDPLGDRNKEVESSKEVEASNTTEADNTTTVPVFSKLADVNGYNARFLSRHRIDLILNYVFKQRKPIQDAKMRGLSARCLKMDVNYKLTKKIRVYTGRGVSYTPYAGLLTVQNEDNMTVYWKPLRRPESISEVKEDLKRLRVRLNSNNKDLKENEEAIKIIWIDNCCTNRKGLKEIFPGAIIKLDIFHWLKRWEPIIADSKSVSSGGVFRATMSQALYIIDPIEWSDCKARLQEKKERPPTYKEIVREARSIVPKKEILLQRIQRAFFYFMYQDNIEAAKQPSGTPILKKFNKDLRDLIKSQLDHVRTGCLSDPDPNWFCVHRTNPVTGKSFTCRGTSSNESDNLQLEFLTGKSIGITRAIRLLGDFFERSNDNKRINRLGEEDYKTYRIEALLLIRTLAREAGVALDELPYKELSIPKVIDIMEDIGFDFNIGTHDIQSTVAQAPVGDETETNTTNDDNNDPEDHGEGGLTIEEFIAGINAEFGEEQQAAEDLEDAPDRYDRANAREIEIQLSRLIPDIYRHESTLDCFNRLTDNQPWVPFHKGTRVKTAIDIEEAAVFETMHVEYSRFRTPSANKGYNSFETAWNQEVANRLQRKLNGENVVLIYRKKTQQLQEHFDHRIDMQHLAGRTQPNNQPLEALRESFNETRRQVPPLPARILATPVQYPTMGITPLGFPTTYNAELVAPALRHTLNNPYRTDLPPWVFNARRPVPPDPLQKDGKHYQRGTWCIKCGFRKRAHCKEERFGNGCKRDFCGRCGKLKQYHTASIGLHIMGPYCREPEGDTQGNSGFWFK